MSIKRSISILSGLTALAAVVTGSAYAQRQDRVCRQECSGAVCQERCIDKRDETTGSGRRDVIIEPEEKRGPSIELKVPPPPPPVPNVDVEINR